MFNVFFPSVLPSSLTYDQPGLGSFRCIHLLYVSKMVYHIDEVVAINYESIYFLPTTGIKNSCKEIDCTLIIPKYNYKQTVYMYWQWCLFIIEDCLPLSREVLLLSLVVFTSLATTLIKRIPQIPI